MGTPWLNPHWLFSAILPLLQQQALCYWNTCGAKGHRLLFMQSDTAKQACWGLGSKKLWRLAYLTASGCFVEWWSRVWVYSSLVFVSSLSAEAPYLSICLALRWPCCRTLTQGLSEARRGASQAAMSSLSEIEVVTTCLLKVAPGKTVIAVKFLISSLQIHILLVGTEFGAFINGDCLHSGEKQTSKQQQQKKILLHLAHFSFGFLRKLGLCDCEAVPGPLHTSIPIHSPTATSPNTAKFHQYQAFNDSNFLEVSQRGDRQQEGEQHPQVPPAKVSSTEPSLTRQQISRMLLSSTGTTSASTCSVVSHRAANHKMRRYRKPGFTHSGSGLQRSVSWPGCKCAVGTCQYSRAVWWQELLTANSTWVSTAIKTRSSSWPGCLVSCCCCPNTHVRGMPAPFEKEAPQLYLHHMAPGHFNNKRHEDGGKEDKYNFYWGEA